MNLKRRYCCLVSATVAACLILFASLPRDDRPAEDGEPAAAARPFVDGEDLDGDVDGVPSAADRRRQRAGGSSARDCRMSTCFDLSRCRHGFSVHVHPADDGVARPVSSKYGEILRALRASRYYTDDPERACILVLAIDTLDRDRLSSEYVANIQSQINALKWWRGGVNHVVFNLYSGTWPDYNENGLGFDVGGAMLAKASTSRAYYRPGFDISFPLFHKEHSFRGGEPGMLTNNLVPPFRKYLLSFKGKRYLTGIGSETRNSLYHIHNGQDVILLTTCKHGKGWKNLEDKRCETDNTEYDKWDYKTMLRNSTFCLVPRGRRLGSYRFLEVLQAACVPVLLSNDWVLPFSEVIDWNKAAVWGDERLLLQVPGTVRSIAAEDILSMRQQSQFLWDTYFSSIEKIVSTTLEILKDRVEQFQSRSSFIWNVAPGAIAVLPEFSQSVADYPFYWRHLASDGETSRRFTAVIYVASAGSRQSAFLPSSALYRLIKTVGHSQHLHKIILVWRERSPFPTDVRWPVAGNVSVVNKLAQSVADRLLPFVEIETDAVLSLSDDVELVTDEVEFGLSIWRNFPDRIVGSALRSHFWDDGRQSWSYTSKWTNDYSLVLTSPAFFHRYYLYLYTHWLPQPLREIVAHLDACDDILLNFLVAHVTHKPPAGIVQRRPSTGPNRGPDAGGAGTASGPGSVSALFSARRFCVGRFVEMFGYVPLVRSSVRLEPLLHRDAVSVVRKKYRHMEIPGS